MKLEAGKRYVTRSGKVTNPLACDLEAIIPFVGVINGVWQGWTEDGRWMGLPKENFDDLVREVLE